jgi:3'(2'), 5'-bisphosphate nucleotidase
MIDHELAAGLATRAGDLLLDVRAEFADATMAERKALGDKRSHHLFAAMAELFGGVPCDSRHRHSSLPRPRRDGCAVVLAP